MITQGLDGTAMPSFDSLSVDDRWALAFYAGHFAFPDTAATEGPAAQLDPTVAATQVYRSASASSRSTAAGEGLPGSSREHSPAFGGGASAYMP